MLFFHQPTCLSWHIKRHSMTRNTTRRNCYSPKVCGQAARLSGKFNPVRRWQILSFITTSWSSHLLQISCSECIIINIKLGNTYRAIKDSWWIDSILSDWEEYFCDKGKKTHIMQHNWSQLCKQFRKKRFFLLDQRSDGEPWTVPASEVTFLAHVYAYLTWYTRNALLGYLCQSRSHAQRLDVDTHLSAHPHSLWQIIQYRSHPHSTRPYSPDGNIHPNWMFQATSCS